MRRLIIPEVVQTSALDCGPASLKSLLDGFRIPVSYGRLREACQTDVDGTSIDTMEEVAGQLGLEAEQVMVPRDHAFLDESKTLPAIVVLRLPGGGMHFLVVWRRHGPYLQVMDPACGRRWISSERLAADLHVHAMPVDAGDWRGWAGSPTFVRPLERRLHRLGVRAAVSKRLVECALTDPGWRGIAALDAATRMTTSLVDSGALGRGRRATRVLETFFERAQVDEEGAVDTVPEEYWSVQPYANGPDGSPRVLYRGAVLVRALGRRDPVGSETGDGEPTGQRGLSPELVAALAEPPSRPGRELFRALWADGLLAPAAIVAALSVAAAGVLLQALLFRGLIDIGRELPLPGQRLGAMAALFALMAALALLNLPIASETKRMGRQLEMRFRVVFLEKIRRLGDRFFRSRLTSDMAERCHSVQALRAVPALGFRLVRVVCSFGFTAAGVVWLDPESAWLVAVVAAVSFALPLAIKPLLVERDLRFRIHGAALTRFYLDALLGLVTVRTHGAERAIRREHEALLSDWSQAGLGYHRVSVLLDSALALFALALSGYLVFDHVSRGGEAASALLFTYWALSLPGLGGALAGVAREYPALRNVTLRLLEPLGAPDESPDDSPAPAGPSAVVGAARGAGAVVGAARGAGAVVGAALGAGLARSSRTAGVAIALEDVTVRISGSTVLEDLDVAIAPGSHVAIVGPSGAGKSSFAGLLLGWYRAATGRLLVDGALLDGNAIDRVRRETAWVDPSVQLWNRSLLENLCFGAGDGMEAAIGPAIDTADLASVLERLPDGLQTSLGEGGGLVSGGEGQRVRFGRAIVRGPVRLAILDEPFRAIDRERRRELLAGARERWRDATLLCITHDVGETRAFERVLVMEGGRIVEDGSPAELAVRPGGRYAAMLEAEDSVRERLWASPVWRRLRLARGRFVSGVGSKGDKETSDAPVQGHGA